MKVVDRSVVTTSHAETRVVSPAGLQPLIDDAVAAAPSGQHTIEGSWVEVGIEFSIPRHLSQSSSGLASVA